MLQEKFELLSLPDMNRRHVLKSGLLVSLLCLNPLSAWAGFGFSGRRERTLSLLNTHTGEQLQDVVYWQRGNYLTDALSDLDYVLRDHRTDEVHPIDPITLDLMAALSRKVNASQPFEIISGYRSPKTNEKLRGETSGVAKNSYHMKGQAVDLRLPGVPLEVVRKAALELRMGGVGYYPKSDFVHLDSGRVRSW